MQPATQTLVSIVRAAAVAAVGAFVGALTLTTFPATLDDWKHVLVPAFVAVLLAERTYLSKQAPVIRDALLAELRTVSPELSQALAVAFQSYLLSRPTSPETTTTTTTMMPTASTVPVVPSASSTTTTTSTVTLPAPPASTPPANPTVVG